MKDHLMSIIFERHLNSQSHANCFQQSEIKILIDLTDVVFSRHGAMVMFMNHCPAFALNIIELSSVHGMNTLYKCCHQSWVSCHHYVLFNVEDRQTLQVQDGKPQTGAKTDRIRSVLRSTNAKHPHTVPIIKT